MENNQPQENPPPSPDAGRLKPPGPHEQKSGLERRVAILEGELADIRTSHLEGHKWFITAIFTVVAILLTFNSYVSKTDVREEVRDMRTEVRDSTKDMQGKVDTATSEMTRKFEALSGEALKKPFARNLNLAWPPRWTGISNNTGTTASP